MTKTLNLALQGGGTHGAFTWGILDAILEEQRIQIDSVSATSAGAVNAVVLAHGLKTGGREGARVALHKLWNTVSALGNEYNFFSNPLIDTLFGKNLLNDSFKSLYLSLINVYSPYQINPFNLNPLRQLLDEFIDFDTLKEPDTIKLFISATNVKTGKIKVFENKDLSVDSVMASACLPTMFQAVKINDDFFWDGGYMGNPALYPLIYNSNSRDILIIHINPICRDDVPTTTKEILNRINEISFNSSLMREMRAIGFVNNLLDNGWIKEKYRKKMKRFHFHAIRADTIMKSYLVDSKQDTSWSFLTKLYEEGRVAGKSWLKSNYKHIGKRTSIDIGEYL